MSLAILPQRHSLFGKRDLVEPKSTTHPNYFVKGCLGHRRAVWTPLIWMYIIIALGYKTLTRGPTTYWGQRLHMSRTTKNSLCPSHNLVSTALIIWETRLGWTQVHNTLKFLCPRIPRSPTSILNFSHLNAYYHGLRLPNSDKVTNHISTLKTTQGHQPHS